MYNKKDIIGQLELMGAPRNSVVTVHSSLKAVGEIEGRGEGLLETLIEYFTSEGGLLVIPTHTWANFFDEAKFALDLSDSRTCIGTLPDLAAKHPSAHRSEHPTHSVAVFGDYDKAEEFIADDAAAKTCCPPEGCYGKIYRSTGKVLLIGVGHNRNTYLHCVEEMLGVPNRTSGEITRVRVRRKDGSVTERDIRFVEAKGIGDVSARFPKLEPAFREYSCITDGFIGDAKAMLCDAAGMKTVMETIFRRSSGRELMADDMPIRKEYYTF